MAVMVFQMVQLLVVHQGVVILMAALSESLMTMGELQIQIRNHQQTTGPEALKGALKIL